MGVCPHGLDTWPRLQPSYAARRPEQTALYQVLKEHLSTFLAELSAADRHVPAFVERELRALLQCGIHAGGFVRVRCPSCRRDTAVAFSCKGRGICPSCGGRRMADAAAHWLDHVLPDVPMRQWVLTLPFRLRYLLAYDAALCSEVLGVFVGTLFAWQRRRAEALGVDHPKTGSVTAIQRFGSALNLNVHFHTLSFDGVYALTRGATGPVFVELAAPTDGEIAHLAATVRQRVLQLVRRRGRLAELDSPDPEPDLLSLDEPTLAAFYSASIQGLIATGHRAGRRVERYGGFKGLPWVDVDAPRTARIDGFSLHADVSVPRGTRDRLERVCRYMLRPAIAYDRISLSPKGKVECELKRPFSDGTTHILFEPTEFIEKLAALVPYPQKNLVRYHGVLAPNARWRPHVVPRPLTDLQKARTDTPTRARVRRRRTWAELMLRVFAIDVLACPDCGARMRIISTITDPKVIAPFLKSIGLPPYPPTLCPARAPPDTDWD